MKIICISVTKKESCVEPNDKRIIGRVLFQGIPVIKDNDCIQFVEEYGRALYHKETGHKRLTYWDGKIETILEEAK